MPFSLLFVVVTCLFSSLETLCQEDDRVKITTYYETLCPDSISFIRYQLWPTYEDMSSIMKIDLVPYGKAQYNERADGTVQFRSQHGSRETQGNKIQACAIKLVDDMDTVLRFVYCMQSQRFPDRSGQLCAERNNLTWSNINNCAEGRDGEQALLEMGKRTESLSSARRLSFVPTIVINDKHSQTNQDLALSNLARLVCENYSGSNLPTKCEPFGISPQRVGHTPNTPTNDAPSIETTTQQGSLST